MTAKGEEPGQRNDQAMEDIVRDADEYYNYLSKKHAGETRLDVAVVSLVCNAGWFLYGRVMRTSFPALSRPAT